MTRILGILSVLALFVALGSGCVALTGETMGQNIDDTNITAAVKTKLAAEKVSTLMRIEVETTRGVVHLTGIVDTAAQRARAEQIASQVGGVRRVVNNLQTR